MTFILGHKSRNTGRTWWQKGHEPWNKGKKGIVLKPFTGWEIICIVCGNKKYYQFNEHKKRKRLFCSPDCYHEYSRKSELVYSAIHSRINRDWGKADHCEEVNSKCSKVFDWANISDNYLLERTDWKQLCRKHHIRFDKNKKT